MCVPCALLCSYSVVIWKACHHQWLKSHGTLEGMPPCEFGCKSPRAPLDVFRELAPIPQPAKKQMQDEHFLPFHEVYGKPVHFTDVSSCPSIQAAKKVRSSLKKTLEQMKVSGVLRGPLRDVFHGGPVRHGAGVWNG